MKLFNKVVCGMLAAALCISAAGCGKKVANDETPKFKLSDKYPIDTNETLRVYVKNFTPNQYVSSLNDTEFKKYLEEATGVKIVFETAPVGSEDDGFNLMLASDDLPDVIICGGWRNPEADSYLDDKTLTDLTPYLNGGAMPNLKKILDENPEYDKQTKALSGRYFYAPMILGDDILRSYMLYVTRQDLLDKAGLQAPETVDEWEKTLTKFKEMGVKYPITIRIDNTTTPFLSGFGVMNGFYHEGNTVKFGANEDGYYEYLRTMARWYKNGLLDPEFVDQTSSRISQIVTSGECASFYGAVGGGLGTYMSAVSKDSGIRFAPTKAPAQTKGEKPMWNMSQSRVHQAGATIGYTSTKKELAARFIDFGYSEKGQKIWNFGKEGVSYTMKADENGEVYPHYTDIITDPAKRLPGTSISNVLTKYASVGNPISVQSKWYLLQVNNTPEQRLGLQYANDTDVDKYMMPPLYIGSDKAKSVNDLATPINTYIDEQIAKIITGRVDTEKGIGEMRDTLKKLKLDELIKMHQEAYDSYLKNN